MIEDRRSSSATLISSALSLSPWFEPRSKLVRRLFTRRPPCSGTVTPSARVLSLLRNRAAAQSPRGWLRRKIVVQPHDEFTDPLEPARMSSV